MMANDRAIALLKTDARPRIAVFGDFCLDKYLYVDAALDEASLETGLTAHQVVKSALYPGGAGCVAANLCALGATVRCVGVAGDDGDGFELLRALRAMGADADGMAVSRERATCCYLKPMRVENGRAREMNRIDTRNFTKTPAHIEDALLENLREAARESDAVMIQDQFVEDDLAAVTRRVRDGIADIAREHPDKRFFADSRGHMRDFRGVTVKCNRSELSRALGLCDEAVSDAEVMARAEALSKRNGKPVFVTMGERGQIACDGRAEIVPAFPVTGEIDIVGAGDACGAGTAFALALGLSCREAARVGNAASAIAIQQIGVTGVARRRDVCALLESQSDRRN